ncbi:MAG: hypothetical protein ACRD5W_12520 [Candidatus Acidiferrales bacterium]
MTAGRPRKADPGTLYAFAHQFYWDFRRLAEGTVRWRLDEKEFRRLASEGKKAQLSHDQVQQLSKHIDSEIKDGRLKEDARAARLQDLKESQLRVTREWLLNEASDKARKQLKVPGEPEVLRALLRAKSPFEVRKICMDATVPRKVQAGERGEITVDMPNWPLPGGSVLPTYLAQYAREFIAAKTDRRFPRSGRPSSQLKKLWFLSRALAGALYGVTARTATNLVGSRRPEQVFQESRGAKSSRKRRRRPH